MKIHIKGGRIVDPVSGMDEERDILVVNGIIERISSRPSVDGSYQTVDMKGNIIVPGLLDMHVHLREPGYEHKETIETGCESAREGGFTAVCCMPNTNPAIDDESVARYVRQKGQQVCDGIVEVYPIAAATKGRLGEELSPMAELAGAGAVGYSDDGSPIASAEIMRRVLEYSSMFGIPVIQHAEEPTMTMGGCINEGFVSTKSGLPGIPPVAEELMVARDLILLRYIPAAKYHVAHISTASAIELVRRAKADGLQATAEATPHHFTLTDDVTASFDTNTKMNPPLRTADDVEAVRQALKDGTIDAIATDHAPHTIDEKEVEYIEAPFGIVGLETAIGLTMTELVETGLLALDEAIAKLSTNPRRIVGLPAIKFTQGEPANMTFIDPRAKWTVDVQRFKSKSKNSPFHGRVLTGKAIGVLNNGKMYIAGV
ncbi:MAG: dihydroorotase [Ignavibacteria bacterium GWA2_55_11]|nr:MAG: dihydroorotase [Ignavibacteria bacterium GWA2_55_11]OGU63532.1 MAG: dihydroorotase [Ignavibacteria bacterium RIFCSPHIGHO2_02_FULL_56_12]OGU74498.1 MAG: dihydroorotase [Ignavibacteria bacterium RIFCSPLOWO2_02_FULL_55_14]OGU76266.1 MAG: dihydroorotase [Ignavibacteria bacterium RIFCSPLOWO2_12_FULL_56_21]